VVVLVPRPQPDFSLTVEKLKSTQFSSASKSEELLFEGVDRETIDFKPIFKLAAEFMTYLAVVCR
jgi:hypothetical protein